ncbi:LysR family transcriptional regulator [Paludibacterium paludis]|uniref:LysR family transcriptional regulator n=1 Tax=Paludibacterium paludis TaxID=1225769 RepID=A0A918P5A1_9NEIS|nr:LysR family transcriptional regulator [Paludibacterium paludis]GGY21383.1 LysR family transcriptional regulator [Paludibacterium paludis]
MSRTNDWNDWYLFCVVAQTGGFTRAAQRLDLPKSSVSTAISRLETRLGLRLMERSTRVQRLTEAGQQVLSDVAPLFARLDDVADHLKGRMEAPLTGTLRIASPYEFAHLHVGPVVVDVMAAHPGLRVEVEVISGLTDPASAGFDLSFVMTSERLPDSGQIGKRLYTIPQGLYATPAFLADRPVPDSPEELSDWPRLGHAASLPWRLRHADGRECVLPGPLRLQTVNASLRMRATMAGIGVCLMSRRYAAEAVDAGLLREVLPNWSPCPLRAYALIPNRTLLPTKTRLLLDGLEERFAGDAGEGLSALWPL